MHSVHFPVDGVSRAPRKRGQALSREVPIFFPLIMTLDFGLTGEETAIWFGILTLIVVEVGLITPPVGLNVFIINKMAGDVKISDTFRGVVPFFAQ